MIDFVNLLLRVARLFDRAGARYAFVGSVASSRYGQPRSTNDIDLITDLSRDQMPRFIELLADDYYFNEASIRRAIDDRRSFNLIHHDSSLKIDVFIAAPDSPTAHRLTRRKPEAPAEDGGEKVFMITPEDTLLAKLEWFRKGGGTSDRQWSDITNIIKVRGASLDASYLRTWAAALGVSDLLEKVLAEAG